MDKVLCLVGVKVTAGELIHIMEYEEVHYVGLYLGIHPNLQGPLLLIRRGGVPDFARMEHVCFQMVGINPPLRAKRWKKMGKWSGSLPSVPPMLDFIPLGRGSRGSWLLVPFSGPSKQLGSSVPCEYQVLDSAGVINWEMLEDRLITGVDTNSYVEITKALDREAMD